MKKVFSAPTILLPLTALIALAGVTTTVPLVRAVYASNLTSTGISNTPVRVAEAGMRSIAEEYKTSGIIEPARTVAISAKVSGRLVGVYAEIGSVMTLGDTVAKLDDTTSRIATSGILQQINALDATAASIQDMYTEKKRSAEVTRSAFISNDNGKVATKMHSAITESAITIERGYDFLNDLLSMRDGVENSETPFVTQFNFTQLNTARISNLEVQRLYNPYKKNFNENILNRSPSESQLTENAELTRALLTHMKIVLDDVYVMLARSTASTLLTEQMIERFKTETTSIGANIEAHIQNLNDIQRAATQAEIAVAAVDKELSAKESEIATQRAQLSTEHALHTLSIDESTVYAPFSGVITEKFVEVGSFVAPGTPLFTLSDNSYQKVIVALPDSFIEEDTEAHLTAGIINKNGTVAEARIVKIYPQVDPVSKKTTLELAVPTIEQARVGTSLTVIIAKQKAEALAVPAEAVRTRYGKNSVFVLREDGTVTERFVSTGTHSEKSVEIIDGLADKEKVIVSGARYLRDGDRVTIITN